MLPNLTWCGSCGYLSSKKDGVSGSIYAFYAGPARSKESTLGNGNGGGLVSKLPQTTTTSPTVQAMKSAVGKALTLGLLDLKRVDGVRT